MSDSAEKKAPAGMVLFRYIMRELLLYFSIAFLFFFLIFFVNQILLMAEDLLKKRVPLLQVAELITYSLPFIIAQSAPFATLVGFLMCLGRMMSDNEVLVFRATGNSYMMLLFPVLLLSVVISIVSFFVNDYLLPLGTVKYNELYQAILLSNPAVEIESNSIKRTKNSMLVIGEVTGRDVSDLVLFDTDGNNDLRIIVAGNSYIASPDDPGVIMQLEMSESVSVFMDSKESTNYDYLKSGKLLMNIFASTFFPSSSSSRNPREMTAVDLYAELRRMRADGKTSSRTLNVWDLEFNKKFSLPFGSFFFAILAMPLSIIFGKRNGQTIGLIVGIVISVLYWALMILGQTFGFRNGFNGFWAMWIPNLLVGGAGILFYWRLVKK